MLVLIVASRIKIKFFFLYLLMNHLNEKKITEFPLGAEKISPGFTVTGAKKSYPLKCVIGIKYWDL